MGSTSIEWATHTVNWLAGCTKVSPACTHCYAERMTRRMASGLGGGDRYQAGVVDLDTGRWTGRIAYDADALHRAFDELWRARKPRRVFVNSMSDTFHDDAPPESLGPEGLAGAIAWADRAGVGRADHKLLLLTKRPENLLGWQRTYFRYGLPSWVWVGCTVEDQQRADERVPLLLQVQAVVRFLSVEPLLGAVDLAQVVWADSPDPAWRFDVLRGRYGILGQWAADATGAVSWVIAGGESGPKARPSHPAWFQSLRDQCVAAEVPFFFKQWGEWVPRGGYGTGLTDFNDNDPRVRLTVCGCNSSSDRAAHGVPGALSQGHDCDTGEDCWVQRMGKKAAGRLLDGRTWDEVPRG